jgi:hypothetical protein
MHVSTFETEFNENLPEMNKKYSQQPSLKMPPAIPSGNSALNSSKRSVGASSTTSSGLPSRGAGLRHIGNMITQNTPSNIY